MARKKGGKGKKKSKELPPPPVDDYDDSFIPASVLEDNSEEEKEKEDQKRKQAELEAEEERKRAEARDRKRQQKIEKKQKKEQEQIRREKEIQQAKLNAPNPRVTEAKDICKKIGPLNLMIHDIPADGNCLYRAIAHRYSATRVPDTTQKDLRIKAAKYMREHSEDFIPFIDCDGDPEENFASYCDIVENSNEWGGELEIRALAHALESPITVYSASSKPRKFGEEFPGEPLLISYHKHYYALGAHYNAIIPA